jgi:predicted Zn-dependent peptidase
MKKQKDEQRDNIERELVRHDKQKLITQCLKLYDSNVRLADELARLNVVGVEAMKSVNQFKAEVRRLTERTMWQIINERIQFRIDKIRSRRKSFNSPTK